MNDVPTRRAGWWVWLAGSLLLLTVALTAALTALVGTEAGSRLLVTQVLPRVSAPMQIGAEDVSGHLLDRLVLRGLIVGFEGGEVRLGELTLAWRPWSLSQRELRLHALHVADANVRLDPSEPSEGPPQIPDIALPLNVVAESVRLQNLKIEQGEDVFELARLDGALRIDGQRLDVSDLAVAIDGVGLRAGLGLGLSAPHLLDGQVQATVDAALTGEDIGVVEFAAVLGGRVLAPEATLDVRLPVELTAALAAQLDRDEPSFALQADWDRLPWPLRGEPTAQSHAGRLSISGTINAYRVELATRLTAADLPDVDLTATGSGSTEAFRFDALDLGVLDGQLRASGEVGWTDAVAWAFDIDADGVDPGVVADEWPGRLDAQIATQGQWRDEALTLALDIDSAGGTLRGYPVGLQGRAEWADDVLRLNDFVLGSDENRLRVDGSAGEDLALTWRLDAPALDAVYPDLAGALSGQGEIQGTRSAPRVLARLEGHSLAIGATTINALDSDVDWRESGGKVHVTLSGVVAEGQAVDKARVQVDGAPESHRVRIAVDSELGDLAIGATGGWEDAAWTGRIERWRLNETGYGDWVLAGPVTLAVGGDDVRWSRACLARQAADSEDATDRLATERPQVCSQGTWRFAGPIVVDSDIRALPLSLFAEALPEQASVDGTLDGTLSLKGTPERPEAVFRLTPSDGTLSVDNEPPVVVTYRNAVVAGRFAEDRGEATLAIEVLDNGQASGRVVLGPDRDGRRALKGDLSASFDDLALVEGLVNGVSNVQGRLRLEAKLGGSVDEPTVNGQLRVEEGSARLEAAGIQLEQIEVSVAGEAGEPLTIDGRLQSGPGWVRISGRVDPRPEDVAVDLAIDGEDFLVAQLPEAVVHVSPALRLRGARPMHLSGRLVIPYGRFELKSLPEGSVSVTADEIIIEGPDADALALDQRQPDLLTARVDVVLGDDVRFEGFGLRTGLGGAVTAAIDDRGTRVDGRIELLEARYQSWGQDLTVERGRLLFAGDPQSPNIDLRAYRLSRDGTVTAYIELKGSLSAPEARIFSQPSLPEAEALAYLVTGRPLSSASGGDGLDISHAAFALGVGRGEPLFEDLGRSLGLDDLRVEAGQDFQESALVLGKYVNPDLYVGYTQQLLNPEGALLIRMRLNRWLQVETRSGIQQSVDLLVTFEHD